MVLFVCLLNFILVNFTMEFTSSPVLAGANLVSDSNLCTTCILPSSLLTRHASSGADVNSNSEVGSARTLLGTVAFWNLISP